MILIGGIPSESPLALVRDALDELGVPYVVFNQRRFATTYFSFEINQAKVSGWLEYEGAGYRLEDFCGAYLRLMDHQLLPELKDEPSDSAARRYCSGLHYALIHWSDITPARVVNRLGAMGSNSSKPYQAQLIRQQGLEVPETLITSSPELALEFRNRHQRIIYKSMSGVRSIVQTFEARDVERLDSIRWCPTQFQEYIEGTNVRVHVVGSEVFATVIESDATDYRYAQAQTGHPAELRATEISDQVAEKCIGLTSALGLAFAGIDLKFTPDNRVFCFEVNPCPGFSYFEANSGQPIAKAVARYLSIEP